MSGRFNSCEIGDQVGWKRLQWHAGSENGQRETVWMTGKLKSKGPENG
jgi:hypothetical protein